MRIKQGSYIGVGFDKQVQKFKARIRINGVKKHLGTFDNEIDAAIAYDNEVKLTGIGRRLNFPEPEPENNIPNTKLIRLTLGLFAIVDLSDFERLNKYKWHAVYRYNTYYAERTIKIDGKRKTEKMSRIILGLTDPKIQGDHIDRNGLNNQRSNLRPATNQQNSINQVGCNKSSKFKGVFFDKERNKFMSQIKINYKSTFIGRFDSEIDAVKSYDKKAKKIFGEFAYLNFN